MYRVAILTVSDRCAAGVREDTSGPLLQNMMEQNGYLVTHMEILPDERALLSDAMRKICDIGSADLILTTGGTGLSPRDWTPEATLDIAERQVPGLSEAMRAFANTITPNGMLSRGASVIRKQTLILNLPGSANGAIENLSCILPALEHGLATLTGTVKDCTRKDGI